MAIASRKSGHMISSLPSISLAIWSAIALSLVTLSLVLTFSRANARYPGFSILIYFTTFGCFVLLVVGWFAKPEIYLWPYYAYRLVSDILTAGVAWEVYRKVFGPAIALPARTPQRIAARLLMVVSAWALLSTLLHAKAGGPYTRLAVTGEQMLYGALAGAFSVLVVCSHRMGISWRPRVAAIVRGLAVILVANLATAILRGFTHGQLARTADDIGQLAYLLSYSYWAWCFLEKEQPIPDSPPRELVLVLAKELDELKSSPGVPTQV